MRKRQVHQQTCMRIRIDLTSGFCGNAGSTIAAAMLAMFSCYQSAHALSVSNLAAYQVIQRTSDRTADITARGSCNASVRSIEFQVAQQGGAILSGFSWKSAGATIANLSWSCLLKALPVGGEYTISMRGVDASGAVVDAALTIGHILVGDIWIASGQSNIGGTSEAATYAYCHGCTVWSPWALANHNLSVSFARTMYEKTGVPQGIAIVCCSGCGIVSWDPGQGSLDGGYGICDMIDKVNGSIKGFIWYQGETDAESYQDGGVRAFGYRKKLQTLLANVRTHAGNPALPCLIVQIGNTYPPGSIVVRGTQFDLSITDPNVATIPVYDLTAELHLSAAGQDTAGKRLGLAFLREFAGLTEYAYGPRFESAWFKDAQRQDIMVKLANVKDSLVNYASDPERYGFFILDTALWRKNDSTLDFSYTTPAGMLMAIDTITRLAPDKLNLRLKAPVTVPVTISYGRSGSPAFSGVRHMKPVTDGTNIPMPTFFNYPVLMTEPVSAIRSESDEHAHYSSLAPALKSFQNFGSMTANMLACNGRVIPRHGSMIQPNVTTGVYLSQQHLRRLLLKNCPE